MNPLTNVRNISKLSEQELYTNNKTSWHDQYRNSAWIFIGGLPFDLTEGDIICIFSQYGEIVNINLIRDKDSGKSKGFCFLCYEDQRSTDLAVDNFNGTKVMKRVLRVDHVSEYKIPKGGKNTDEETKKLYEEGCAPKSTIPSTSNPLIKEIPQDFRETLADQIQADIRLPSRLPIYPVKTEPTSEPFSTSNVKEETDDDEKTNKKSRGPKDQSPSDYAECEKRRKDGKKSKRYHTSEESGSDTEKEGKRKKSEKSKRIYSDDSTEKRRTNSTFESSKDHRRHPEERKRRSRSRSREYNKKSSKYSYSKHSEHRVLKHRSRKSSSDEEYHSKNTSSTKTHRQHR